MPFGSVKEAETKPVDAPKPDDSGFTQVKGSPRGGKWFKFENRGETLDGVYQGTFTSNGKFGAKTGAKILHATEGEVFINLTSDLVDKMTPLPVGTTVRIRYTGKESTKSGGQVKKFEVLTKTA